MKEDYPQVDSALEEIRRQARQKQRAAAIALILLAASGIGLLWFISVRTRDALQRLDNIQKEIATLEKTRSNLMAANDGLEEAKKSLEKKVKSLEPPRDPNTGEPLIQRQEQAPALVYIHITSEDQREKGKQLSQALYGKGLIVPGIERVYTAPSRPQVRFFRREDESQAVQIAEITRSTLRMGIQPTYVGLFKNVPPKQFEVWFSTNPTN